MVAAGIIILQIKHLSISQTGKFAKQKVKKFVVVFRKHWSSVHVVQG
jgi:hypothetical protein